MATELKRMTFVVTPDVEEILDKAKKMFYNKSNSEMIRALITAGVSALETEKQESAS